MLKNIFSKKKKDPKYVYDKASARMIKVGYVSDATYCATPVIIEEGFKFRDDLPDGKPAYRTVVKKDATKDVVSFTISEPVPL